MSITIIRTVPAIESSSIYVTYDRPVAQAALSWRPSGQAAWRRGLDFWNTGAELQSCLYALEPGTSYDIQVSVAHTDGSNDQAEESLVTLPLEPPAPIEFIYVSVNGDDATGTGSSASPYRTIARAMQAMAPGKAIRLYPGTWNERVAASRAGIAEAWCHIVSDDPANPAVLVGGGYLDSSAGTVIFSNYRTYRYAFWHLADLVFQDALGQHMFIPSPDLYVNRCRFGRWGVGGTTGNAGIRIVGGSGRVRVLDCSGDVQNDDVSQGSFVFIWRGDIGGYSFLRNRVNLRNSMGARDFIQVGPENQLRSGWAQDGEAAGNYIEGTPDDGIQLEGECRSIRVWDNTIVDCFRSLAFAPVLLGPVWVVRNKLVLTPNYYNRLRNLYSTAFFKIGDTGFRGPLFLYNNTCFGDSPDMPHTLWQRDNAGKYPNVFSRNNLWVAAGRIGYLWPQQGQPQDFDRDVFHTRKLSQYFTSYETPSGGNTRVQSLAELTQATGQEANGLEVPDASGILRDPFNLDFTPVVGSVVIDRAVEVPGVAEAGDDVGAVESGLTADTFTLTVSVQGQGTVTPSSGQFLQGTPVTLTATPAAGWRFVEWQGDVTGTQNTAVLTMDGDKLVTAVFELAPAIVMVSVQGSGTTDPAPGSREVTPGSSFTITAIPAENWQFAGWTATGGYTSPDLTITVTVTADMALVATFEPVTFEVTIEVSPLEGGTTVPAPGTASYQQGQDITITAVQAGGYYFVEWRLNGQPLTPSPNPLLLTVQAPGTVTAVFDRVVVPPNEYSLGITALPGGTTEPAPGAYGPFPQGTVVAIEARPDAGKALDRWEYFGLTSRANPLVLQINQDTSVLAVWRDKPQAGVSIPVVLTVLATGVGLIQLLASTQNR